MNRLLFWLSFRMLKTQTLRGGTGILALVGLTVGVASLVVAMAVMSGFQSTLQRAVIDVSGDMMVMKRGKISEPWQEFEDRIRSVESSLVSSTRFLMVEAVAAGQGQISGVLIQGLDFDRVEGVLNLKSRMTEGRIEDVRELPESALVGAGLAKRYHLKIGDSLKVVVPVADEFDPNSFRRKVASVTVRGILDLGKYEYNERYVVVPLKLAQDLASVGDKYQGLILKFQDSEKARAIAGRLSETLGVGYWVKDWREINENLFAAVEIERPVIFFVLLVIVIVAAFNVSSHLFVGVIEKYAFVSVLRTFGLSRNQVLKLFSIQGVLLGFLGVFLGVALGLIFCSLVMYGQTHFGLLPGSVYKLDKIDVQVRFVDLIFIVVATMVICFLSTLAPARKGASLNPVDGLKYE